MKLLEELIDSLYKGVHIPLCHSFLIASGIEDKQVGKEYLEKFKAIYKSYQDFERSRYNGRISPLEKARSLFDFLSDKIKFEKDKFLFYEVIDARYSSSISCGNCLGLTCLYNALVEEEGIPTGIIKKREHVLTRINTNGREYYLENTNRNGFDVIIKDLAGRGTNFDLMAYIIMARVNGQSFDNAIKMINLAKTISPRTSLIYSNLAAIYFNKGDERSALENIEKAIQLDHNPIFYKLKDEMDRQIKYNKIKNRFQSILRNLFN